MASQYVSLNNSTDATLYLCVQVDGAFQEWSLPAGGSQTVDSSKTDVVLIQSAAGQCPS